MKKLFFLAALLASGFCFGQQAKTIRLKDLQKVISEKSDKIQIINFWATWCGPCVKELPFFEKITAERDPRIQIMLVSMDLDLDPNPEKVYKFISRKNIQSRVVLLNEPEPETWIDKVEKEWSGSLPATLLINQRTGNRKFVGRALQEGQLEMLLKEIE
jgi:thiol-disulfide isomerase/thioredoxin